MHKETYFAPETITEKAHELLMYVSAACRRHANLAFRPEKAALLVLDMQAYFLQADSHAFVPSAPVLISGMNKLISAFESAQRPVIATRHRNTPEDAGMMSKWWRDLIKPRTAYSHFSKKVKIKNPIQISKTQYDAFHQTELEDTLHNLNVTQVIISGVMTHLCCESTARSAFMRGFEVFFTVDGTATYNEELHRATLLTLSHGFAVPVLVGEILAEFEQ